MNGEKNNLDMLGNDPSKADIEELLSKLLVQHRKVTELFADDAKEKLVECITYPGVFAPSPATFDRRALMAVWATTEEASTLFLEICLEVGVLVPAENGRYMIPASVREKVHRICEKYLAP